MICPSCNSNIPDDSVVCPACRATLSTARERRKTELAYCKGCGALVPDGAEACPSCGMPVMGGSHMRARNAMLDLPDPKSDLGETQSFARIESAVPDAPVAGEPDPVLHSDKHGTSALLVAALAALLLMGSIVLVIAHPWNPDAYSTRATEAADTSKAGFPGTLDALAGQDKQRADTRVISGDESSYQILHDGWAKMADIADRLDASETDFWEIGFGDDTEARAASAENARVAAIELPNLIDTVSQVDVSSGTYKETRESLVTLGNWLRNRADALTEAWDLNLKMEEDGLTRESVAAPLLSQADAEGVNAYGKMFREGYADAEPQEL